MAVTPTVTVSNGVLTVTVDLVKGLKEATPSASGKSILLASTGGSLPVSDGKGGVIKVGLNVFKARE